MVAPLTQHYAAFAASVARGTAIPQEALDVVRLGFTDCAGVFLAGLDENVVLRLKSYVAHQGGTPQARLLLGEQRVSAPQAGLVNATAAHAHDYDDFAFTNHPSAVLMPAIFAAAEAAEATGAIVDGPRMARAYVAGYEIWGELMKREPDHLHSKGWHPTAVFGPIAVAAAAAVVYGFDERRASHALALACSLAGGVFENFGTMAKPMHGGRAAEAGLVSAALASEGVEASPTAIEGERGLMRALSPTGKVDLDRPSKVGSDWLILKERLNIKKYPTVGASQRSIDAVLRLLEERRLEPGRVVKIIPRVSEKHLAVMPFMLPQTGLEAKFSLPFVVSCALLHGRVGLKEVQNDIVRDPAMQEMMARVEIATTKEFMPDWPSAAPFDVVKFHLDDGAVVSTPEVRRATGHGDTPLSGAAIRAKFDDCADYAKIDRTQADRFFLAMQNLLSMQSVREIPSLEG